MCAGFNAELWYTCLPLLPRVHVAVQSCGAGLRHTRLPSMPRVPEVAAQNCCTLAFAARAARHKMVACPHSQAKCGTQTRLVAHLGREGSREGYACHGARLQVFKPGHYTEQGVVEAHKAVLCAADNVVPNGTQESDGLCVCVCVCVCVCQRAQTYALDPCLLSNTTGGNGTGHSSRRALRA